MPLAHLPKASSLLLGLILLSSSACAPQREATPPGQASAHARDLARTPKVLTLGIQREPKDGIIAFAGNQRVGGASNARDIAHNELVFANEQNVFEPQLAVDVVSVEKGDWRIFEDGTMETVWRLRPNVTWHDGTPFTSADLLFALTLKKDRDVPWTSQGQPDLMTGSAPDALTFVVRWSALYWRANEAPDITPLPRHILEERYREDKPSLVNSPWFTTEFVGLGPYRVERWEPGSHIEFVRFDNYFQGRPPLDTVILRFLGDPNTMVANILAGEIDVLLPRGVEIEGAAEVKRRWEGTENQVRFLPQDFLWQVQIQHRTELARPRNGLVDRTVRQAFYQAIDRQALVEAVTQGLSPVADSWIPPMGELRSQLTDAVPQFPYDPGRAQQLVQQAGWARGADGALVHVQTGERFEIELRAPQAGGIEARLNVIADGWKELGAHATFNVVPTARVADAEYTATFPGGYVASTGGQSLYENRLHSSQVASPTNRWAARNRVGYSNPRVDSVLDRLAVAIDSRERLTLHRELLQEQMGDVALMPLYWEVSPLIMLKGVSGPIGAGGQIMPNFFDWRKD